MYTCNLEFVNVSEGQSQNWVMQNGKRLFPFHYNYWSMVVKSDEHLISPDHNRPGWMYMYMLTKRTQFQSFHWWYCTEQYWINAKLDYRPYWHQSSDDSGFNETNSPVQPYQCTTMLIRWLPLKRRISPTRTCMHMEYHYMENMDTHNHRKWRNASLSLNTSD